MNQQAETKRIKLFSSGRLCLFGEHSDWAGQNRIMNAEIRPGRAIVTGIEQGIYAEAYRSEDFALIDRTGDAPEEFHCEMNREKLRQVAQQGGYFSYICGVASYICEWYHVGGLTIEITGQTLPMKGGLSSSAAICVLVAKAFHQLYDLHLNTLGIMNIAYWGEQRTPSRCGRLDQACAFGVAPVSMTFDGHEIDVKRIPVRKPLYYVFADLCAGKDTVRILADLNKGYPFADDEKQQRLHEALGKDNLEITERAMEYISKGDAEKLGELMTQAQALFDEKVAPMSPQQLSSPVLHETLADPIIQSLTYGGKGVGSQGDGCVQFLAKDEESQQALHDYLQNEKKMKPYKLTLRPNSTVRKAIIPVAGFGTRLYPATRGIKKEFCPVVDKDGLVKPVLLVLLEELDAAGIEEICLIINPGEKDFYEDYFRKPLSLEHYASLPAQMKEYEDSFRRIADKVTFMMQEEQKGFGHAVYQADGFAAGDPVLLLLGDTIYQSNQAQSCAAQFIREYDKYGGTMVALRTVPLADVSSFGMFAGSWEDKENTVMKVERVFEKPSPEYAKDYLGVKVPPEEQDLYYGAFGMYILDGNLFAELGRMCRQAEETDGADHVTKDAAGQMPEGSVKASSASRKSGRAEVELTAALEHIMMSEGLMAFVPDGESFDIGNAKAYRETFERFGK
ncbi:MAG: hypothetical protein IK078_02560 [Lachnospiraceae bacterium]|nr:hypothetical protein [Lachnospiraceae bacterium]